MKREEGMAESLETDNASWHSQCVAQIFAKDSCAHQNGVTAIFGSKLVLAEPARASCNLRAGNPYPDMSIALYHFTS